MDYLWSDPYDTRFPCGGASADRPTFTECLRRAGFGDDTGHPRPKVVMGPLGGAALRFFAPARERNEYSSFLWVLGRLLVRATGLIILFAGCACLVLLLTGKVNWLWLCMAAFAFAVLSGYNSTLDGLQNAARQRPIVAWHQAFATWSRFFAAAGMVMWIGESSTVTILGYVSATLLVLFSQFWFFRRTLWPEKSVSIARSGSTQHWESQMFCYAWPFAIWGVFTWMQIASDRWALQMFASTREVGLYAVLYQLGYYPIIILTSLMAQMVMPMFFQHAGDASDLTRMRRVHVLNWRLTVAMLIFTGVAGLMAAALHRVVFVWLVAPEYHEVSWLLPGMVLAGGLFATGQIASIDLMSKVETKKLIAPKIVTAAIGVILNFLGAAWYGVPGVVGSFLTFSVSHFIWVECLVIRGYRKME